MPGSGLGSTASEPPAPTPRVLCEDQLQTVDHRVDSFSVLLSSCFHMWRGLKNRLSQDLFLISIFFPFLFLSPLMFIYFLAHFLEVGWGQMV